MNIYPKNPAVILNGVIESGDLIVTVCLSIYLGLFLVSFIRVLEFLSITIIYMLC